MDYLRLFLLELVLLGALWGIWVLIDLITKRNEKPPIQTED